MDNNEISVFKALDFIRDNAQKYAQAKANRIYLEEFKKSLRAKLMIVSEQDGNRHSSTQERDAYASEEYKELLVGIKEAVNQEEQLRWLLEGAKLKIAVWQTMRADQRAEAKII